ncbi:HAMP domain-containing protein [Clostridium sp. WILCCON 0269]|uniref:HAMP domain-containing protein n=1 Tax=Candidatus Clostridium eludens TaxID=3381663 RepID=A0ABW8SLI5_9CLOT
MAVWLKRRINTAVNFVNNLADGDLTQSSKISVEDELGSMAKALNNVSAATPQSASNSEEILASITQNKLCNGRNSKAVSRYICFSRETNRFNS